MGDSCHTDFESALERVEEYGEEQQNTATIQVLRRRRDVVKDAAENNRHQEAPKHRDKEEGLVPPEPLETTNYAEPNLHRDGDGVRRFHASSSG